MSTVKPTPRFSAGEVVGISFGAGVGGLLFAGCLWYLVIQRMSGSNAAVGIVIIFMAFVVMAVAFFSVLIVGLVLGLSPSLCCR